MKGPANQTIPALIALVSTMILHSLTFAASNVHDTRKALNSKLGCMACHQGESIQPEQTLKKDRATLARKKHEKSLPDA